MKIIITIMLIMTCLIPFILSGQEDEWTLPLPLTDSISDNRNAVVMSLNFYNGDRHYLFWEKSFDTLSTHIYCKEYYYESEPVALVEGDYHNTEPCLLRYFWNSDTVFFLLYLSDRDGDYDIYSRAYTNGNLADEVALTNTPGDEKHLRSNGKHGFTWEYEGKIMYQNLSIVSGGPWYFIEPQVIDSGYCKNPEIEPISLYSGTEHYLIWEKVVDENSQIWLSEWGYQDGWGWLSPEPYYIEGHNTGLGFEAYESNFGETTICWTNTDNAGLSRINCMSPGDEYGFTVEVGQQQECFPAVFNIIIYSDQVWGHAILTYIKDENAQSELYVPVWSWLSDSHYNLSQTPGDETNPNLFNGKFTYPEAILDVINIWESNRNGHWQLYSSIMQVSIPSAIKESQYREPDAINIYPNPFRDQITVYFNSEKSCKGSVDLYNTQGKFICRLLKDIKINKGNQSWVVDLSAEFGNDIPAGVYFVKLQSGGKEFTNRIIRLSEEN